MALAPGDRVGAYEVVAPLGAGGMGEVYRARDHKLGRDVALKVLPDTFAADADRMARFEREAKVLAALNHPNIAAIYGLEDRALVLELVEGENLAGPLPVETAVRYALQIASALEAAHEKGIVHRDLKPGNIKVTPAGTVKVLDFGLASVGQAGSAGSNSTQSPTLTLAATQSGVILGTAAYMPPEQARGKVVDKRADIWAFGCVLYEMLVGKQTFGGESVVDILGAVVRAEPEWSRLPADTPENVRRVLRRCLEKDPASRLRDIGDARLELAEPVAVPAPSPIVTRRSVSAWALGGVAAIAGGAGFLTHALWKTSPQNRPGSFQRFKLPLGDDHITNLLEISPDGSRIAYGFNPGGYLAQTLYVRDLNALSARRVKGTAQISSLVFSPDGKWLAYGGTAIYKVPVNGGDPIQIGSDGTPTGWAADGRLIVTAVRAGVGVMAIPAAGGRPEELVKAASAEVIRTATMLPDGNALLFSVNSINRDVVVQTPGADDRRVVVENASLPRYLHSGHILFSRDNSWFVIPFDSRKLRATGAPVPLPPPEGSAPLLAVDDFGAAVSLPTNAFVHRSQLLLVDRQGRTLETLKISEPFTQVRAAPDGKSLLLAHQAEGDVFTYDLKRGIQTRMTFEPGENETPVWSPDGKRFAWASVRGKPERHIMIRNADGSGAEQILWRTEKHVHVDDWSPDGKYIVATRSGTDAEFLILSADKPGEPKPLLQSPFVKQHMAISPDGLWLAYSSRESNRDEIYVRPWPGPGGKWQVSAAGGTRPRWSRNGKELFYNSGNAMLAVPVESGREFSTGKPLVLFQKPFGDFDVLPDGRFVLFDAPPVFGYAELNVVTNWFDELKRIAPVSQ
jgi:serine/threonine-protein kinase